MGRQVKHARSLANVLENNQTAIAGHQNENGRDDVPLNELGSTGRTARSHPASLSATNRTSHVVISATIFWITS
jgi:hypothetical protein